MTRGKYADKARTKRAADGQVALEVEKRRHLRAELVDALAEIERLRSLEIVNAQLRDQVTAAKRQAEEGTSDRLDEIQGMLAFTIEAWAYANEVTALVAAGLRADKEGILTAMRELPRSEAFWRFHRAAAPFLTSEDPAVSDEMSVAQYKARVLRSSLPRESSRRRDMVERSEKRAAVLKELAQALRERGEWPNMDELRRCHLGDKHRVLRPLEVAR